MRKGRSGPNHHVHEGIGHRGMELREKRRRADLTQSELARALGVTQSFIAQCELGYRPIPHELTEKLYQVGIAIVV